MITIVATDTGDEYHVQKTNLLEASAYFRKALDGQFAEATSKRITLPGTDADTVKMLVFWLCKNEVPKFGQEVFEAYPHDEEGEPIGDGECMREPMLLLAKLWTLGDQIMMPKLQDEVMWEIWELRGHVAPARIMKEVWAIAPPGSMLSKFCAFETAVRYDMDDISDSEVEQWDGVPGFLVEFARCMKRLRDEDMLEEDFMVQSPVCEPSRRP